MNKAPLKKLLALIALGAVGSSSLTVVDQGEVAIVYRFGAINRTLGPGLGVHLPWPMESLQTIRVSEARRLALGSRRMLTRDTNLVELGLVVQHTVREPIAYATNLADPDAVIAAQVLSVATKVVSTMEVDEDELLTTGRSQLQQRVRTQSQQALDAIQAGVQLEALEVAELAPPAPVVDAFNDVSSARGDRDTKALAAEAYTSKLLPDVRGNAARTKEEARADANGLLARTMGDTDRFSALLAVETNNANAIRTQLYAETIGRVGQKVNIIVADQDTELTLPFPTESSSTEGSTP